MESAHRFLMNGGTWYVWRDAFLRTTGFPSEGLDRLSEQECAKAADAFLADGTGLTEFRARFQDAVADNSQEVSRIAGYGMLREAITWQNPSTLVILDALCAGGPDTSRNSRRRYREQQLSRYWQRYCAKAETIGFFGPGLWITVDEHAPRVNLSPGTGLIRKRQIFLEPWAYAAYGALLAADAEIRRWLPPAPVPHYVHDRQSLRRPGLEPAILTDAESAVLSLCDGTRPAASIVAELAGNPASGIPDDEAGYELLACLAAKRLLTWDANLAVDPQAGKLLDARIAAIGDERVQRRARAGLDRLRAAAERVAAAAGAPQALQQALAALDAEFIEVTGQEPRRGHGRAYAGRGVCYEDTTRDLSVVIGRKFLDDISPALSVVLDAARWVTHEAAAVYRLALNEVFTRVSSAGGPVYLSDLWEPAIELFYGTGRRPIDEVMEALAARWDKVLQLSAAPPGTRRLHYSMADVRSQAREVFHASGPGWSLGRIHSPDVHICASSADAINDGNFLAVLGEIHIAHATMAGTAATWSQSDPQRVLELSVSDCGRPRLLPLLPTAWTKDPGRNVHIEHAPSDLHLAFARAKGIDRERLVPVSSVSVVPAGDALIGVLPDGRRAPLIEFFAFFLSQSVVNAFKSVLGTSHTPRVTVDRLVLFRETWRVPLASLDSLSSIAMREEEQQYIAARRLVAELGLPDRCFVKISTETKPFYVDFTSPLFVSSLCTMLRSLKASGTSDVTVTISEMLPDTSQAWVSDGGGKRYFGEIRFHFTDAAKADPGTVLLT